MGFGSFEVWGLELGVLGSRATGSVLGFGMFRAGLWLRIFRAVLGLRGVGGTGCWGQGLWGGWLGLRVWGLRVLGFGAWVEGFGVKVCLGLGEYQCFGGWGLFWG